MSLDQISGLIHQEILACSDKSKELLESMNNNNNKKKLFIKISCVIFQIKIAPKHVCIDTKMYKFEVWNRYGDYSMSKSTIGTTNVRLRDYFKNLFNFYILYMSLPP